MVMGLTTEEFHADTWSVFADRLELGAGGGLVGLAVALECNPTSKLLVTDQVEMLDLMRHNILLNGVEDKAEALILNWYVCSL
jgi:tRNA1(Val) A37 N6-methylase TrmN6